MLSQKHGDEKAHLPAQHTCSCLREAPCSAPATLLCSQRAQGRVSPSVLPQCPFLLTMSKQPYVILQTELTHSTGLKWTQVSTKDVTRCSPAHGHKKPSKWTTREIPHMAATRSTLCSCILKVNCTLLRNWKSCSLFHSMRKVPNRGNRLSTLPTTDRFC